jgi:DNA-binding MarR family transcriptional regulator
VERERLRAPVKSEEAYHQFYASEEATRLFEELIIDKLAASQIMLLLRDKPLSTGEIGEMLDLSPSEVSRHINSSSRHGFIRYDENRKRYALASG